jgi:hypothetical protein
MYLNSIYVIASNAASKINNTNRTKGRATTTLSLGNRTFPILDLIDSIIPDTSGINPPASTIIFPSTATPFILKNRLSPNTSKALITESFERIRLSLVGYAGMLEGIKNNDFRVNQ